MTIAGAPACFGAASVYAGDSDVCKKCHVGHLCGAESLKTLEAIRGIINVEDLMRRHEKARRLSREPLKPKPPLEQPAGSEPLLPAPTGNIAHPVTNKPVERKTPTERTAFDVSDADGQVLVKIKNAKAKEIAYRMVKGGDVENLKTALLAKVNIYADRGPAFMRIAVDMLLSGGLTKSSLRKRLEKDLDWTEGTAGPHVAQAVAIFAAFKITQEKLSVITLVPALTA